MMEFSANRQETSPLAQQANRRRFLAGGLTAALTSLRCQRNAGGTSRETLRVAMGADRYNLSRGRFTFATSRPNVHLAEALVRPNGRFEPEPWLLEQWRHEGGGSYVARLRREVRFHDGTPLRAEVLLPSMKRFLATRDFIGLDPESLLGVDEYTIRMRSATGSARMIDNMTHPAAAVFLPGEDVGSRPVGTGPYRLARYEPQRWIEVERFADYWGPRPAQARIRYRFMPDPQARLLALQAGEVDVIGDVVPELLLGLVAGDPSVVLRCSRPIRYVALMCNVRGNQEFPLMRDVRIRRALALSIDREAIARTVYAGRGEAARGLMPGWMFGLGEGQPAGFGYDGRQAAELLEEAGWQRGADGIRAKGGKRLQLRLVAAFPNASSVRPIPEMLGQMFRQSGVDLEIVQVEDDSLYYSGYADEGQGDLFLEMGANANADPTFLLTNLFHSRTPWRSYRNMAPGGEIDGLLDGAREADDRASSVEKVREAQRRIVDEHVAAIPILLVPAMVLTRPEVVIEPFENLDWMNLGEARWTA